MSYEVLARRFRPQTLDDVAGQRHVSVTLRNALLAGRLPHAILFTGPRGVGKTTLARVLARSLNCDEGPTDKPCGKCAPCTEIANSISLDVQEIDAASNTGVDNVREIRESVRYSAAPGKHRIFIIDEVHMLSNPAFNALLKTLEEPPPQSLFIFATTEPQKIPATVLSRVQRFDLRRFGSAELQELLRQIAAADEIELPESVMRALVREADGSARDALTLLERLISGVGKKITEDEAAEVLDLVDSRLLRELLDPVLSGDPATTLAAARRVLATGIDPARVAGELLVELRNLLVARITKDPAPLIDATAEEVTEIAKRAAPHAPETLQRLFRVLLTRTQDFAFAPRPDHALEMALVRLATLPEGEALATLIARLDGLENTPSGPSRSGPDGGSGGGGSPAVERARQRSEKGRPAPKKGKGARPAPKSLAPEREAELKREAKTHPSVLEAIEVLDAELVNVHPPRVEPTA